MKLKYFLSFSILLTATNNLFSQGEEKRVIASIYYEALSDRTAYNNLKFLCKNSAGRVLGSPQANEAVDITCRIMTGMGLDTVYRQKVFVPSWKAGEREAGEIRSGTVKTEVPVVALTAAIGTGKEGLEAGVVEVQNFDQLTLLSEKGVKGKIVFFNRPMDPSELSTFTAYEKAKDQRLYGASKAATLGATGVVVRSVTTSLDDIPHTGVLLYDEGVKKIPAVAISTNGADLLSTMLKKDPELIFRFLTTCETAEEVESANVVGEIRGTVYPDQIITIAGHLDAMHVGEGAHDDATGCIQSIEVLRLFKKLGIRPKRTIRAVMFMDEELSDRGLDEYIRQAEEKKEDHYFALESDNGGLPPLGFGISGPAERMKKMPELKNYFEPYGINRFKEDGETYCIYKMEKFGIPLAFLITDDSRYFDYHHSSNDTFEQVNIRELQLGSAAMASLIYLIDRLDF